jgi:hypothetical protein
MAVPTVRKPEDAAFILLQLRFKFGSFATEQVRDSEILQRLPGIGVEAVAAAELSKW